MKYNATKEKLDFLLELISKERTGNADDLCSRLEVSQRTLFRYLECLREMGYPIRFCICRNTYYLMENEEKTCHRV